MKILISPLDWGLGHATRCIPIIRYLLEKGCEVVIGADGRSLDLLKMEFPACEFVLMSGYGISYPKNGSMVLKMISQIPKIVYGVKREHEQLEKIIRKKNIDAVISDNRFGLWSREVPCVFMTHQLMIKSPFGERWMHELNKKYISKYAECWIPDVKGVNNLSGDLAHGFPLLENAKYIGILSRFKVPPISSFYEKEKNQLLVILSGPEPQRTVLERKILEQLDGVLNNYKKILIVQGITEKKHRVKVLTSVETVSHLTSDELCEEIISSEMIISRPGYSSVMDLAMLSKKAIFIPTPGQTEQEYLAKFYSEKQIAYSVSQKKFDLKIALEESKKYSGFTCKYSAEEYKVSVDLLLNKVRNKKINLHSSLV